MSEPDVPIIAICREINTRTGERAVYRLDGRATNDMLFILRIRQMYNPELRYFATLEENWEECQPEIEYFLKKQDVSREMAEKIGLVEIGK